MSSRWIAVNLFLASVSLLIAQVISGCRVLVSEPWPTPYLFLPSASTLEIRCIVPKINAQSVFWSVDLASDSTSLQYRKGDVQLTENGVYVLQALTDATESTSSTLRLLVNNTDINNQTTILCSRGLSIETTLFVFEPAPYELDVVEIDVNIINISWSQDSGLFASTSNVVQQMFFLTISHGSNQTVIQLNESQYTFTAPEGAPACEVYNFSVTATYVGATYTGADCSEPSAVISRMLPSLPDINRLESSLGYSLVKETLTDELSLSVSFELASYCEQYPVSNYTLEVKEPSSEVIIQSTMLSNSKETFRIDGNLSENAIYLFRVLVSNTVGVASSNHKLLYTTDVQRVSVTLSGQENVYSVTVQCEFIIGSNATGCRVVLKSIYGNETHALMRNNLTYLATLNGVVLEHPLSCYKEVEAFDIEYDDTIGSIAVPGQLLLINNFSNMETLCPTEPLPARPPFSSLSQWIIVGVAIVLVFLILVTIVLIVFISTLCRYKRIDTCESASEKSDNLSHLHPPSAVSPTQNGGSGVDGMEGRNSEDNDFTPHVPLYDSPMACLTANTTGNASTEPEGQDNHYSRTFSFRQYQQSPKTANSDEHHLQTSGNSDYSTLGPNQETQENYYHELENNKHIDTLTSAVSLSDSNPLPCSSPLSPSPSTSPPIYQEISDLHSKSRSATHHSLESTNTSRLVENGNLYQNELLSLPLDKEDSSASVSVVMVCGDGRGWTPNGFTTINGTHWLQDSLSSTHDSRVPGTVV